MLSPNVTPGTTETGAITLHVNGRRVLACLSLAVAHRRDEITTQCSQHCLLPA